MNTSRFPWKEDWNPIVEGVGQIEGIAELRDNHDTDWPQVTVDFTNGYGISIVRNDMSYGRPKLFECAVRHNTELCYQTPITNDVRGWMKPEDCIRMAKDIAALPSNSNCSHDKPDELFDDEDDDRYGDSPNITDLFSSIGGY